MFSRLKNDRKSGIMDCGTDKLLKNPNLLMLLLLIGLGVALYLLFNYFTVSMNYVYKEEYGDFMYSSTNFNPMELTSGVAMTLILVVGYLLFNEHRYWYFYCLFWLILICVIDCFIAQQFTVYNFQPSSAVSRDFDREVSPLLVMPCGLAYALPFSLCMLAGIKKKINSEYDRIPIFMVFSFLGLIIASITNIIVYVIGLIWV